jgi:recombination associated protein RdgC
MWFKQIQLFQLTESSHFSPEDLNKMLEPLAFTPCLPSFPSSIGWASPIDLENASLVRAINGCLMICLQIEEKILPATVIRQELKEKIKFIEKEQDRRVYSKEKLSLKDEITLNLLPRAFTKLTQIHAYIDTKNQWVILNTTNAGKTEQFLSLFKKSVTENIRPLELSKLSPVITHWLKNQNDPSSFAIEKSCVLQDPNQQNRIIRCQQQDLFASGIQSLIKDGCEAKQIAMNWQDRIKFVFSDNFSLRGLQYQEELLTQAQEMSETKQQQFDANFYIMTETLSSLLADLLALFDLPKTSSEKSEKRILEVEK